MPAFPTKLFNSKQLGGLAALALGLASCEQPQTLPVAKTPIATSSAQSERYYLNAKASTKEVIEQLDPKTVVRMDVLKDQHAADYAHDASVARVVLTQTK